MDDLLIVPTCQQADTDLVRMGDKVENEKDRLLERVSGTVGCQVLMRSGHLLDGLKKFEREGLSVVYLDQLLHWRASVGTSSD